jgi:hypothetical protein
VRFVVPTLHASDCTFPVPTLALLFPTHALRQGSRVMARFYRLLPCVESADLPSPLPRILRQGRRALRQMVTRPDTRLHLVGRMVAATQEMETLTSPVILSLLLRRLTALRIGSPLFPLVLHRIHRQPAHLLLRAHARRQPP